MLRPVASSRKWSGGVGAEAIDQAEPGHRPRRWREAEQHSRRRRARIPPREAAREVAHIQGPVRGERDVIVFVETRVGPAMVQMGATLPEAPGLYSVTLLPVMLEARRRPPSSTLTSVGPVEARRTA